MMIKILAFLVGYLIGIMLGAKITSYLTTKRDIKRQKQALIEYCEHKSQIVSNPIKQKYYKKIGEIVNE